MTGGTALEQCPIDTSSDRYCSLFFYSLSLYNIVVVIVQYRNI